MNANRFTNVVAASIFACAGIAHAGGVECAIAAALEGEGDEQIHVKVLSSSPDGVAVHTDARTIEIRMENDDVHVRLNGEDVPDSRIIREEGKIVIVNEEGEEIESIYVGLPGAGGSALKMLRLDDGVFSPDAPGGGMVHIDSGPAPKVMLGIHLEEPDAALRAHLRLEAGSSTMISAIYEDLPAHRAGLEQYDVITKVDGAAPADPKSLREALDQLEAGGEVALTVIHNGKEKTVSVTVDGWDPEAMANGTLIGDMPAKARMFFRGPGGEEGGELLWENLPQHLHHLYVDKDNQLFEALHGAPGAADEAAGDDADGADDRIQRLNERLRELEEMLDRVLREAKEK